MADFFKGLSGGFQSGLQFGEAMRAKEERERLREAMGLTPQAMEQRQATPEELSRAQAETQGLAAQDAAMFGLTPQDQGMYAPQMPVEGQRIGATQYGLGGQTYNRMPTQQEIDSARYAAAANVIGERDPAAAFRMRQEQVRMQREAELAPLQLEQLRGSIAGQAQQGILTSGQITEMNRNQARTKKIDDVDADVAQWQSKRLLDPNTNELRQPTMDDNIAALQYRATALQKAGLAKEATDSLRDYQGFAVNQIKLDETQRNSQLGAVAAAIAAGDLNPAVAFYDRYVLDGAKVTGMKTDPKTGAITVSRVRDDGAPMPDKVIKGGANELLAALNSFKDPMALYNYSQNEFTNNLNLRKTVAAEQTATSTVALNNARASQINQMNNALATNLKNSEEAKTIQAQFSLLDDTNDPGGSKRQGLITQFNMLSVKAGGTIPTTGGKGKTGVLQTPVELKKQDDGTYTAFSKDGGRALYNTFNGEPIPLGMEVTEYKAMKDAAKKNGVELYRVEDNGALGLAFVGPDGQPYKDLEKAKYSKPAKSVAAETKPSGLNTATVVQATAPTPPTEKPVKASGESFESFRNRTIAWDRNRIAYDQMLSEQQLRERLSNNALGLQRPLAQ